MTTVLVESYSATNNTWDSSDKKVKILRAASRKFQDLYNPIYFSHDYSLLYTYFIPF